jgi:hypothetical protein
MTRFEIIVRKYIVKNGGYPPPWAAAPGVHEALMKQIKAGKVAIGKRTPFFVPAKVLAK